MVLNTWRRAAAAREASGCLTVASAVLIAVFEVVVVAICFIVMYVALKTNGFVLTETLESTRQETWADATAVALVVSGGSFVYYLAYSFMRWRFLALLPQLVFVILVIGAVAALHAAVPLPPGTNSPGIPGP
jgi:hypothetical protein